MSTFSTLYLLNRAAPFTPPTIRGTWSDTTAAVTKALDPSKTGGGVVATVAKAEVSATNPFPVLLYRGVSGPLAAQTISGTINVIIGILESSASADFNLQVHVYVTQGDTDTPRGTLLSNYSDALGVNEWPTTATGKALNAAQTLSALAITAGDRIVVEIGYIARNTVTTSFTGTLTYGAQTAAGVDLGDLTAGSTSVTTLVGSISFSNAITQGQVDVRVSQLAVETVAQPVPAVRVSQLAVETVAQPQPAVRVSQLVIETVSTAVPAAGIRISQFVIETVCANVITPTYLFPPLTVAA